MANKSILEGFFKKGLTPSEENFKELIQSGLNRDDDGLQRVSGRSLAIKAADDNEEVLSFYNTDIAKPSWMISQKAKTEAQPSGTAAYKSGLNISDDSGNSRLFIKKEDGNIGVGTIEPAARLHIKASGVSQVLMGEWEKSGHYFGISMNGSLGTGSYNLLSSPTDKNLFVNRPAGNNIHFRMDNADQMTLLPNGNFGIGTNKPRARLEVSGGAIMPAAGNTSNAGILFPADPQMGETYGAWLRYSTRYSRSNYVDSLLEIGIGQAPNDNIALMPTGNVGVGTLYPMAKLQVSGGAIMPAAGDAANAGILIPSDPFNRTADAAWIRFYKKPGSTGGVNSDPTVLEIGTSNDADDHIALMPSGNVGVGTQAPRAKLEVFGGAIMPSVGNASNAGITFPNDPAGGGGDSAWIRYYARTNNAAIMPDYTVLEIGTSNDANDHIALMPSGNVGVGTITPVAKLDVYGHVNTDYGPYIYMTYGSAVANYDRNAVNISIKASERIVAKEFNANSDARIKKGFAGSNTATSLKKINQLAVTEFLYKDEIQCGNSIHTGLIAQEVEKVFPEAVSVHPDFIPDIYALSASATVCEKVLTVTTRENHGLQTGDMVRLIMASGIKEVHVTVTGNQSFEVHNWEQHTDSVFIYGKKVPDFRTVNYNSIFTVGISAIQEIYKQLQQLKEELSAIQATAVA